jgi:hypothetical protein
MMFCCNTGEAGCCTSSSSSDVDVEDPFATGSKIVGVGICAGVEASTGFPGTTWLASSRRSSGRFNGIYGDDFPHNQIKMINRLPIFFFGKKTKQKTVRK